MTTGLQTAVVLMTHNYNYDKAMLNGLLQKQLGYIGVLGPLRKLERMFQELEEETGRTIDASDRQNIFGPTGLDIGAETAEEIALSIMAEIKMVMQGKSGLPLRDKDGAIHEPVKTTLPEKISSTEKGTTTPSPAPLPVSYTILMHQQYEYSRPDVGSRRFHTHGPTQNVSYL